MTQTKTNLIFYQTDAGGEPVREWLKGLAKEDRRLIGLDLTRAQFRWPVGMPLVRPLGKGLHEVRINLPNNRIARVFLCFCGGELVALHSCIKKTQRTDPDDLKLARKRLKEVMS
jgi:phage-related protein